MHVHVHVCKIISTDYFWYISKILFLTTACLFAFSPLPACLFGFAQEMEGLMHDLKHKAEEQAKDRAKSILMEQRKVCISLIRL